MGDVITFDPDENGPMECHETLAERIEAVAMESPGEVDEVRPRRLNTDEGNQDLRPTIGETLARGGRGGRPRRPLSRGLS